MVCDSQFWVIAALASWAIFVAAWMLAKFQTRRRPQVDATVSGKRRVVTRGEAGSTSYLAYFRDSAGKAQPVAVSRRVWKKTDPGDPLVVYKKEGRRAGYGHVSRPFRTASLPTVILLGVSGVFALFLPITAAMSLTGTAFPGCG